MGWKCCACLVSIRVYRRLIKLIYIFIGIF